MRPLKAGRAPLILAVLLLLSLSGCHGRRASHDLRLPEELPAEQTITFWAKNDTNRTQTEIYQQAIRDFEALYPGIHVNLRLYTDYGKIYNDVITNLQTGTTPNVCITYPDHIATYRTGEGTIVPLATLASDPRWGLGGSALRFEGPTLEEIVPAYLAEGYVGGELCALPFMRSTEACYVNRTMVERLGFQLPEDILTWDFLWEVADAAAATKGADGVYSINGQQVLLPFLYKSTDNMMIQYLAQKGAPYATEGGEILLFGRETGDFLSEVAGHTARGAFSTFKISSYPANFLNAGQCLFAVDSTAGSTWMGSDAPLLDISPENLVPFETAVYPVPQIDPAHPRMISQGPSICLFSKPDPGEVLCSWLFLQFLLTDGVQVSYAQTEGYVPVTTRARESAAYQDYLAQEGADGQLHYAVKLQATKLLLAHTTDTFTTPVFNGSASLRDAAGALIESTVKGVRRKQTMDAAWYQKLYDDTAALYRLGDGASGIEDGAEGPLPPLSLALLLSLAGAWVLIVLYVLWTGLRKRSETT